MKKYQTRLKIGTIGSAPPTEEKKLKQSKPAAAKTSPLVKYSPPRPKVIGSTAEPPAQTTTQNASDGKTATEIFGEASPHLTVLIIAHPLCRTSVVHRPRISIL